MELFKTKPTRGHMPVKRIINLATVGEKSINPVSAIPAVALVIVLAVLFSKVAVTDRFAKVRAMQREVSEAQKQVDAVLDAMDQFGDMKDRYAHYTYSGLSDEERYRTDRIQLMDMIERMIMPNMVGGSWSVSGNTMVLNLQGNTLESINQLTQQLLEEPLVENCVVTTARKSPDSRDTDPVVASVTITFVPGDATVRYNPDEEEETGTGIEMVDMLDRRRQEVQSQGVD